MKIKYNDDPFSSQSLKWMTNRENQLETIELGNAILKEYDKQGYQLSLRQLFYQFVGRGLFDAELLAVPSEGQKIYKNFGTLITKARNNGLMSWTAIEDRGRNLCGLFGHEEEAREVVKNIESLLSLDHWERQEFYIEVWVEKDALGNVISRACETRECPYLATKGYLSASEAWRAGRRFKRQREAGKGCVMIHLGDHDPEGIDMTRDNRDRLFKYSDFKDVEVRRIALNMDQIEEHEPPPNYAKASSSRFDGYVAKYGEECWELDALEPSFIVELIETEIEKFIDTAAWEDCDKEENEKRHHLEQLYPNWTAVKDFLDTLE